MVDKKNVPIRKINNLALKTLLIFQRVFNMLLVLPWFHLCLVLRLTVPYTIVLPQVCKASARGMFL